MELRLLLFASMLLMGYCLRRSRRRSVPLSQSDTIVYMSLSAITLVAMWLLWYVQGWSVFLNTDFFLVIPVDAAVAGVAVGYLLADQQLGAEQALLQKAELIRADAENADTVNKYGVLGLISYLPVALRNALPGLTLATLAVLAVVPPSSWNPMFDRIHSVKAAGLEVGLGPAAGDKVVQGLQDAGTPRGPHGTASSIESRGFISDRIARMETLTHPAVFLRPEARIPEASRVPTLQENPSAYLFTATLIELAGNGPPVPPVGSGIREIDRDRAMLLHLIRGHKAEDTRAKRGHAAQAPNVVEPSITNLGGRQAEILALLRPHVACVKDIVKRTGDRRLLQYRTTGLVQELLLFAKLWSSIERRRILELVSRSGMPDRLAEVEAGLLLAQAKRVAEALDRFATESVKFSSAWPRTRTPDAAPAAAPPEPAPSERWLVAERGGGDSTSGPSARQQAVQGGGIAERGCETRDFHNKIHASVLQMLGVKPTDNPAQPNLERVTEDPFGRHGFTPYLAIFVAQALSALDDHTAAIQLLTTWYTDLQELTKAAQRATGLQGDYESLTRDTLMFSSAWYSLSTFVHILMLQRLSDNTDYALPPTEAGLQHLLGRLYPDLLKLMGEDPYLPDWQGGSRQTCRAESHSWRQSVVLSYAGWVKDYLDFRNRNFIRPADATPNDLKLAEMLGLLNLECFRDMLRDEWQLDEQRAQFSLTETSMRMNELAQDSIDPRRRDQLRLILEHKVNHTLDDLGRHRRNRTRDREPNDLMDSAVYGRGDAAATLFRSAERLKERLDKLRR